MLFATTGLLATRLFGVESTQKLSSPNGVIAVEIQVGDRIRYDVAVNDAPVLKNSTLSLKIDATVFGQSPKLKSATSRSYDGTLRPVVRQKAAELREHYTELRLDFEGGYAVVFRAYDEGVAYRWETSLPAAKVTVFGEEVALNFADNFTTFYPEEEERLSIRHKRANFPLCRRTIGRPGGEKSREYPG